MGQRSRKSQQKVNRNSTESQGKANEAIWGDDEDQIFHISPIWNIFCQTDSALGDRFSVKPLFNQQINYQVNKTITGIEQAGNIKLTSVQLRSSYGWATIQLRSI